jgi:hypothetical protein
MPGMSEETRKKRFRVVGVRSDGTRAVLATGLPKHKALDAIRFGLANAITGELAPLEIAFDSIEIAEDAPAQPPDENPA